MFDFNLFKKPGVNDSDSAVSCSYVEVLDALHEAKDNDTRLDLKIEGDYTSYTCRVSAISDSHRMMVVDRLLPPAPMVKLREGLGFELKLAIQNSEPKTLASLYMEPLIENVNSAHQLSIPNGFATEEDGAIDSSSSAKNHVDISSIRMKNEHNNLMN